MMITINVGIDIAAHPYIVCVHMSCRMNCNALMRTISFIFDEIVNKSRFGEATFNRHIKRNRLRMGKTRAQPKTLSHLYTSRKEAFLNSKLSISSDILPLSLSLSLKSFAFHSISLFLGAIQFIPAEMVVLCANIPNKCHCKMLTNHHTAARIHTFVSTEE